MPSPGGGVAVAVIGSVIGIVRAAHRGTAMWIWPALGVVVIAVSFGVGVLLAGRVARKTN